MTRTENTKEVPMKKYILELPESLHTAAKAKAALEQTTLKELITRALQQYLEGR
jgi:predicted HicB family RNase H-like nuclease